jgi:hypothetical protein
MNVIRSELCKWIIQLTTDPRIPIIIPIIQSIYKIEDFAKSTKNVGELINIINSNKLYDCSYLFSVLSIQSNEQR